jgi:iron complex transport system substrate-binding protein
MAEAIGVCDRSDGRASPRRIPRSMRASLAGCKYAKDRVTTPDAMIDRAPDIIIGSWCGKKFSKEKVASRPGFDAIPAVRNRRLYEIESALILQPGPAALTDGLVALENIIQGVP